MVDYHLTCISCKAEYPPAEPIYTCPKCDGLLDVTYDHSQVTLDKRELDRVAPHVWKYRELLPVDIDPVTIYEGGTPLYKCDSLAESIGVDELYVKHEGMNPTGSFKDRGMTVGVTKAIELGKKTVACASTGNTSASMAIFAAKAGLPAVVLLPAGKVALGKVAQALMHGAKALSIKGNFDDALRLVRDLCDEPDFYLLNSVNPFRIEGQKTIAHEVADQLGWAAPDRLVLPVGNAGNITAITKGFREFHDLGLTDRVPMMTGIQAAGSAPVVQAIREGWDDISPVEDPETVATAIRIGDPVNATRAIEAIRTTGGAAETVSDEEITQAQRDLAQLEGIGVEPASAASIAGLRKLVELGEVDPGEKIVCVTTGHLLKDPEAAIKASNPPIEVEASISAIRKAVFG